MSERFSSLSPNQSILKNPKTGVEELFFSESKKQTQSIDNEKTKGISTAIQKILQQLITDQKYIQKTYEEGQEKEQSFSNFISPENAMGFSTRLTGDKTFTAIKLETLDGIRENTMRIISVLRLFQTQLGLHPDISIETLFHGLPSDFQSMPEGIFIKSLAVGKDLQGVEQLYHLNKARYLQSFGGYGAEMAEPYFDLLSKSPYSKNAKQEAMQYSEKFHSHLTSIANGMLSYDQLLIFAASGGIGTLIAKGVSKSSTALEIAQKISEIAGKIPESIKQTLLPGVSIIQKKGTDGKVTSFAKGAVNLSADLGKFAGIHELAAATGSESITKITDVNLALIPGVAHGYLGEIKKAGKIASISKEYSTFRIYNGEISITKAGFENNDTLRLELLSFF